MVQPEQVVNKNQIVRESLVGEFIHPQRKELLVRASLSKILFYIGAGEDGSHFAREPLVIRLTLFAQIPARELMVPAVILELLDGALICRLQLACDLILVEELGHSFVESRVVGISVELAAI